MQDITIIIPNYNGRQMLENCIKTLEKQTVKNFLVLVIDNGSTDGSETVTSNQIEVKVIQLDENQGFCGAVNLGIGRTKTPYLILLNNDTEVEEHFVEELHHAICQDERIFSCGAQMLDFKNRTILDNAGDLYTALGWARARGKGKSAEEYNKITEVFSCCGGAAIYRTELFEKIGKLDENHFAYLEDVDLGYRARIAGYKNKYIPTAKVYHVGSATTGTRYNEKKVYLAARNSMFVVYKNMPLLQIIVNLPFIVLGMIIKSIFFLLKGFGKEYIHGIADGLRKSGSCMKVKFKWANLKNYLLIQLELWKNMILMGFE